jgi:hypothetical protein
MNPYLEQTRHFRNVRQRLRREKLVYMILAALSPGGVALAPRAFGDHQHGMALRRLQREKEARHPGSDDQNIRVLLHVVFQVI